MKFHVFTIILFYCKFAVLFTMPFSILFYCQFTLFFYESNVYNLIKIVLSNCSHTDTYIWSIGWFNKDHIVCVV